MTSSSEPVVAGTRPPLSNLVEEGVLPAPDLLGQIDRVVAVPQFAQGPRLIRGDVRVVQQAFAGRRALAVDLADLGADALLAQQLEAGDEEIAEQFIGLVEAPQGFGQGGMVEAFVADLFPDVGGVFLFDVGVVVLLAGAGAGERDRFGQPADVGQQMVVDELVAVVGVDPPQAERQARASPGTPPKRCAGRIPRPAPARSSRWKCRWRSRSTDRFPGWNRRRGRPCPFRGSRAASPAPKVPPAPESGCADGRCRRRPSACAGGAAWPAPASGRSGRR